MSSDSEPVAKRVNIVENNDDAVKVAAFEGEIEALISQDHPKHRYGEMPDGFSKLVMSPTNRYGAEIQVCYQPHGSLVVEKSRKSAMVRIVDTATLTYRYYWFDQTDFHYSQFLVTAVYWLDDQNLIMVFGQRTTDIDGNYNPSTFIYGLYKIDRQLEKLERVWYRSGQIRDFELTVCIPGVLTLNDEKYFVLTDEWSFCFVSITDRKFGPVTMNFDDNNHAEVPYKQWLIQDGYLYYLKEDYNCYLVRVSLAEIDFTDNEWFNKKRENNEFEKFKTSLDGLMFSTYNKDYILLQSLNYADEFVYHLIDLRNFTWKELSYLGNQGEFAVLYNDYVVLFNHFSARAYPLKDTPLKFRGFQITGSKVPSLQSLAGAVSVFSGRKLSVAHLRILFGFDTE